MRIQWLLLLVAIVLGLGFWAWRSLAPMEVSVVTVERGKAIEAVYASGIVESDDQAEIGSVVAGRVVEVLVEEGQSITRGQPLARLDDSKIRQSLTDAQSRLEWAEKEAARAKSLLREGTGARQAYEKAQTELITAQTNLAVQQQALADLTISAPADGIVQRKDVEVGQSVAAQKALFITGALGRLVAKLDVDERDIPRVRLGANVALSSEAFAAEPVTAIVTLVRPRGDDATRSYRVEVALPAATRFMPGMTVDANIVLAEREGALLVPNNALIRAAALPGQGGARKASVWLIREGRLKRQEVSLGSQGPRTTEITQGLTPDDVVAERPDSQMREGRSVNPKR